jgi:CRISPR-associated protein Csx10
MKYIILTLETQQPVLATSFQGDPNSDVSYSYITGSMIRGAIIGRYMRQHQLSELDLNNEKVKRLFFDANSTRYLNAYLLSQEKKRTLPLPLSWFKDKDDELKEDSSIPVYDFSIDRGDDPKTPKSVGGYFWAKERGSVKLYKEKRRINVHNFRDRKKGRSTDNQGELFRYDALDAGQTFQSVILCEDEEDEYVTTIQMLLVTEPNIWLGGSQSAGYGHTKIIDLKTLDSWDEIGVPAEDREQDEKLSITLLSDALLRNEWGQPVADPILIKQAVEELLNISLPKPSNIFASSTLIGGFNRKWGLPLPQVPALVAGSAIVFEGIEINKAQIEQLEANGIGERREDGFGRVAVNWLQEKQFQASLPNSSSSNNLPSLDSKSRLLAEQMAERIVRNKLEQQLQKQLSYLVLKGDITNSQLSRLESVARQGLTSCSRLPVFRLLRYLPSNARRQFNQARVSDKPLDRQIYEWLRKPKSWVSNPQDLEVNIAGITKGLSHRLAREYTLRLIMAVAKKATKEKNS